MEKLSDQKKFELKMATEFGTPPTWRDAAYLESFNCGNGEGDKGSNCPLTQAPCEKVKGCVQVRNVDMLQKRYHGDSTWGEETSNLGSKAFNDLKLSEL